MDVATVVGLIAGLGLMIAAVVSRGESLGTFRDASAVLIVFGGSFAALLVSLPLYRILQAAKAAKKVLFSRRTEPEKLIRDIVHYAEKARRDGILSLEGLTHEMEDDFLVRGVQMAVDGSDPETIEKVMTGELDTVTERHQLGKKVFDILTRCSPAFGMIGTLIGLIIMLQHMDEPGKIGGGMAVALLTTLYGALAANLIFGPIADKLGTRSREETLMMRIVIQGVMAIQSGDNPRVVEQKLRTFLPARRRHAGKARIRKAA
jgi:chemotaxis protein MotA